MGDNHQFPVEAARVKEVYARRKERQSHLIYDPLRPPGCWGQVEVDRHLFWGLGEVYYSKESLLGKDILEVGCGIGGQLLRLLSLGLPPSRLHGIDLIPDRIEEAKSSHQEIDFRCGNATSLPWSDGTMDAVLQLTCLSSVLDPNMRLGMAQEMIRVLKPGGAIISFDFVWNPINKDTVGIGRAELERLFPNCRIDSRRVFLAPPIARRLVTHFRVIASVLDSVPWLCSHRVAVIRPIS